MGLFSSVKNLFGGGSSGQSTSSTSNSVTVQPITNLTVSNDFKELADVLAQGNTNTALTDAQKLALQEFQIKTQTQQDNIKINLEAQKNQTLNNFYDSFGSFIPLITISAIYLVFIKKKGGNNAK